MTYTRAPITEAVIDIRIETPEGFETDRLRELGTIVKDRYPEVGDMSEITGMVEIENNVPKSSFIPRKTGFRFTGAAKDRLIQAQVGGYSFNKLRPYEDWERFSAEGRELWAIYRELVGPTKITRAALRYINRLELPLPFDDFKKYLRTIPEVSPELPQSLSNFLMQVQIPQEDIGALLILNISMLPPKSEEACSIVLDLDIFRANDLPQADDELWVYFEQLRLRKNKVFEACITDAMREQFD